MFHVENADFIAEKLAAELLPNQEFREVLKNALQAVERRMRAEGADSRGRIEFDVDWNLHESVPGNPWYVRCADNGDGMNRSQLTKYTTTLAVQGADQSQSIRGNQGMGLKISGPTRHKMGILIRALQRGERTMVQVGWDGYEYGLISMEGQLVVSPRPESFPDFINEQASGTVVTFLGNVEGDNTFVPSGKPKGWLLKYLNTRFFRLSNDRIDVIVRVPTGDPDGWPSTPEEAKERMKGRGKSFNLTKVNGTAEIWDDAADRQGEDWRGVVSVPGSAGIPPAEIHWWVLPAAGSGTDVSSRTASGGSLAVLFDNELHDWRTGNQANPFFARLGVLFGKTRIAFVIEPQGPTIASDFARAHVLVSGTPVFESDAWLVWAEQFRLQLPERIKQTMAEEQARLEVEDPDRARRIRDRLHDVMQLLRPRRFRQQPAGAVHAADPVMGAGGEDGGVTERPIPTKRQAGPKPGRGRGIGAVLSQMDEELGEPANEVMSILNLDPRWVTEEEAESFALVSGNGHGLRDRAAALAGTDGRTANILLLNRSFRGFQAIIAAISDWANPEGDDDKAAKIKVLAEEWVEQKMIEAVQGLRQLENGSTWITQHYDEALSPVALTAAFMADRYHTLAEVKRAVGPLRQASRVVAAAAGASS
jgi:hypothetical protein